MFCIFFLQPLSVFLQALEVNVQRDLLHSGVRQYLHRMVICLGDELLKYVPLAVSLLLKDCKVSTECDHPNIHEKYFYQKVLRLYLLEFGLYYKSLRAYKLVWFSI